MKDLYQLFHKAYIHDCDDSTIVEFAKKNPYEIAQHYYFSVNEQYSSLMKKNMIVITITPKIHFDEEGCLYSHEMLVIEELLQDYAMEIASSFYEIQIETTLEQAQQFLLEKGFIQSEKFSNFTQF